MTLSMKSEVKMMLTKGSITKKYQDQMAYRMTKLRKILMQYHKNAHGMTGRMKIQRDMVINQDLCELVPTKQKYFQ